MFEAFITFILLSAAPQGTYCEAELDRMTVCEETVEIYQHGVQPYQLDQLIMDQGWDPQEEFTHHGCQYSEDGGIVIDESAGL